MLTLKMFQNHKDLWVAIIKDGDKCVKKFVQAEDETDPVLGKFSTLVDHAAREFKIAHLESLRRKMVLLNAEIAKTNEPVTSSFGGESKTFGSLPIGTYFTFGGHTHRKDSIGSASTTGGDPRNVVMSADDLVTLYTTCARP